MSFFDKILNQLFPKTDEGITNKQPMISEPLTRKDAERSSYFEWQNSGSYREVLEKLYQAYQTRLQNRQGNWEIHLLQMPAANGFAFTYPTNLAAREFQHLFDLLKDRVLTLNYRLVNADRQIFDKKSFVETKEKYYLKPNIDFQNTGDLFDQQYGNILIELILIDDKPSYLKLVASIYSDRLYTKALDFSELLDEIFEKAA